MHKVVEKIGRQLRFAERTYRIRSSSVKTIILLPFIIVILFGLFLGLPTTRAAALWMLVENHPVEFLTFAFLLLGGIRGLHLVWQTKKRSKGILVLGFYTVVSTGLLFAAMEEVAWGQHFFGFETPSALKRINAQGEVTIHNIDVLQGHSEFFRLTFGLGGLVGVWLCSWRSFQKIGVPLILLPWLLIITVHAGLDVYNDYFPIERRFDLAMQRSSELIEMLIGISGFLFIWLNARMLAAEWKEGV